MSRFALVSALVAALCSTFVPATAASTPPGVSQVQVVQREDHTLTIKFAVPAAYYHPGAGVVVRLTRGSTPAATPSAGYAVTADAQHVAKAGPTLTADVPYTFAIWIRDGGAYSKRVTITTRTLKDTSPPDDLTGVRATAGLDGGGSPRVVLDWVNPCCDDLVNVRIVRNTSPTTTGGTVFTVPSGPQAWVDDSPPGTTSQGFSTQPLYYWLIAKDRAGNFSRHYVRTSVVLGSRTVTGTVGRPHRFVAVYSCCNLGSESEYLTSQAVSNGPFTFHLPPGRYTVCEADNTIATESDPTASCWVPDSGGGHTEHWGGFNEDVPGPNIDLTTATSYSGIEFAASPGG